MAELVMVHNGIASKLHLVQHEYAFVIVVRNRYEEICYFLEVLIMNPVTKNLRYQRLYNCGHNLKNFLWNLSHPNARKVPVFVKGIDLLPKTKKIR